MSEPTWASSSNGPLPVSKMTPEHVGNALRWLRARLPGYKGASRRAWAQGWITIFEGELVRRRIMQRKGPNR